MLNMLSCNCSHKHFLFPMVSKLTFMKDNKLLYSSEWFLEWNISFHLQKNELEPCVYHCHISCFGQISRKTLPHIIINFSKTNADISILFCVCYSTDMCPLLNVIVFLISNLNDIFIRKNMRYNKFNFGNLGIFDNFVHRTKKNTWH